MSFPGVTTTVGVSGSSYRPACVVICVPASFVCLLRVVISEWLSSWGLQSDAKMLLSLGMLMLSATQIYTIFTVQLFAFLNLLPVEADITAVSNPLHKCI